MGGLLELEATGIMNQDYDPGGTTLIDAHNGSNNISHLEMIWTVHHRWLVGERFVLNCYMHWMKLLL